MINGVVETVEFDTETDIAFLEDFEINSDPIMPLVTDPFPENFFEEIAAIYTHSKIMGNNCYYFSVDFSGKVL